MQLPSGAKPNEASLAVAIMGPTATGKSDLAVSLAQKLNGEIISVDSALVYRGLNIGAAKPSMAERDGIRHHLIDIQDPSEPYTAADFCRDAKKSIQDILGQGKTPILAGGTMMYFKALLEGLSNMPEADEEIRADIEKEAALKGWPHIHDQLSKVDPISAAKIHPNHSQRLSRALEVYRIKGQPMSSFHETLEGGVGGEYAWVQIALNPSDRQSLHKRIAERFDLMISHGLVEEVQLLMARGDLNKDLPAIRAVGYRQAWEHLSGEYDAYEMRDRSLAATRQLAKRQLTWLRSWPNLDWVDIHKNDGSLYKKEDLIEASLKIIEKRVI